MTQAQMNIRQEALDCLATIDRSPKDNARRVARRRLRQLLDLGASAWGDNFSENRDLYAFCSRLAVVPDAAVSPLIETVLQDYSLAA